MTSVAFNGVIFFVVLICLAETTAIGCVKKYHNGDGAMYFPLAVLFYALVCYLLHKSFDYNNSMGLNNVIWSGLSVMLVIGAGILFFHEKLHLHDLVASALITSGILIVRFTE